MHADMEDWVSEMCHTAGKGASNPKDTRRVGAA
jgi:hypothetical protein